MLDSVRVIGVKDNIDLDETMSTLDGGVSGAFDDLARGRRAVTYS